MANNSNLQAIANQYIEFAKQVYESARASQDATQINDAISKLQALLQEVQKTYNEFNTSSGRNANGLQYLSQALKTIQQYIAYLQQINQVANKGTLDEYGNTQFADDRTSGWLPTGTSTNPNTAANIGDILQWLQSAYSLNSTSDKNAAYLDSIIQLLSSMQSQQWQQASDDLAYSRTNYNTLVAQYMASGMSRAAAMQAASGSLPSVSGSSVGSIATNVAGGVAADQQAQLTQQANAIAGQNASTSAYAAQMAAMQNQTALEQQKWANQMAYYSQDREQKGNEAMRNTLSSFYSLSATGVAIPVEATVSRDTFSRWLTYNAEIYQDIQSRIANGELFVAADNSVYLSNVIDGVTNAENKDFLVFTPDQYHGFHSIHNLHQDYNNAMNGDFGSEYSDAFDRFFYSETGPRYYQMLSAQAQFTKNSQYINTLATQVEAFKNMLESDEMTATANGVVYQDFAWAAANQDNEYMSMVNEKLAKAGLAFQGDQVCHVTQNDDGTMNYTPATFMELESAGLISMGMTRMQRETVLAQLQSLAGETDAYTFNLNLENMRLKAGNDNAFLLLQGVGAKKASRWINDSSALSAVTGFKTVLDITGMGAAAINVGRFALGAAKGVTGVLGAINATKDRVSVNYGYDEHGYYGIQSQTVSGYQR